MTKAEQARLVGWRLKVLQRAGDGPRRVLAVSPDRRWALVAHVDHWARDIVVADNYR